MIKQGASRSRNMKEIKVTVGMNKQLYESLEYYLKDKNTTVEGEIEKEIKEIIDTIVKKNIPSPVFKYLKGIGIIREEKNIEKEEKDEVKEEVKNEIKDEKSLNNNGFNKQY